VPRRFATLDVFTSTRFAGNPLAVVLESGGLDAAAMQRIAREFNLSETVFVFPPKHPAHRAALRIFTPARELPFAGHPTVGTAVLLAHLDGAAAKPAFVLEETVGPVPCRVRDSHGDSEGGFAEFDVPRLPVREAAPSDIDAMTAALGLAAAETRVSGWPVERWSAGNPFTCVPVRGLEAIRSCRVNLARFNDAFGGGEKAAAFVFCRETTDPRNNLHARMFSPSMGIIEDPATGSAAAALAGYLAMHGRYGDGEHRVRIEQGIEMGRPSLMELTLKVGSGILIGAAIGGDAVIVSEGAIQE
jgi:trans-2,3-dihydro-3-hydroxyanthranilate isomerase